MLLKGRICDIALSATEISDGEKDRAPKKETNVGETRRQMEIIKFLMFIADVAEEHSVFPFFDLFYSNCINLSDCSFVFFSTHLFAA